MTSRDYELPEATAGEGSTFVRHRTLRVKVGLAPLVIRSKEDIHSPQLGTVAPGEMVTVLREVISPGKVRAMIALDSVFKQPEATQILTTRLPSFTSTGSTVGAAGAPAEETLGDADGPGEAVVLKQSGEEEAQPIDPLAEAELSMIAEDQGRDADGRGRASPMPDEDGTFTGFNNVGWVTLLKDGKKLVTSKVRQSAGSRQQHERQWIRRMANDKAAKGTASRKSAHSVDLEMSSDPTGISFAFGGVYPGTLHARGHLHELHNVSYSIGLVGEYLLHVRLRQKAAALPGSPFNLVVMPGPAQALSTKLSTKAIVGTVGMDTDSGCGLLITTADVMGNACVNGGATVTGDSIGTKESEVQSVIEDNGDGSYYLKWNSQRSGTFQVAIKIDNTHVVGSPTTIKLISTNPELDKSELSGDGLNQAVAGKPAQFQIKFQDAFGNSAAPKDTFKLGMALLKSGEKNKEAKMHEDFTMTEVDPLQGLYMCTYKAEKDGGFDLNVWAEGLTGVEVTAKAERIPFPGSPFHCVVSAGVASPQRSFVDGWTKESRAVDKHGKAVQQDPNVVIAGDTVVFRPQICDELGNLAALPDGALDVNIIYPDGSSHNMRSTSSIKFSTTVKGGVTTYDIRHEATHSGDHQVHIRLNNEPIMNSPVIFVVHESTAEVKMCTLAPPSESPLYSSSTYTILLKTFDRFGNAMSKGGLPVAHRLQLIKSGVHDLTTLMPNNNTVEVVDNNDGTYEVQVSLIKITATVKVIVNMDKNIPAAGGELPPIQLTFVRPEGTEETAPAPAPAPAAEEVTLADPKAKNQKLRAAGAELMDMLGSGVEGMKAKSTISVAAEAFEEARQTAQQRKGRRDRPSNDRSE